MKNIFTFLALLFVAVTGFAQTPAVATKAAPSVHTPGDDEQALLWKIEGNDLETHSWLYGTIHIIGKDDFFMTDATKKAFKEVDRVTFEINMEEMSDFSVIFSLMGKIMMDGGTTLEDLLTEEDYKFVEAKFAEKGLPMYMMNRMKPMFLTAFPEDMSMEPAEEGKEDEEPAAAGIGAFGMGGDTKSYEMEFMEMAQTAEKEMAGLETIDFQLSMFDSIPYKAQADMLVEGLKSEGGGEDQFAIMVEMYTNQQINEMVSMIESEDEGGMGEYEEMLLTNRNRNWIPIMNEMMADKQTFFAVGAGHLGGDRGVVALLREAGYTCTPIEPTKK